MKRREVIGGIAAVTASLAGLSGRASTAGLDRAARNSSQGGHPARSSVGLPDWVPNPGERRNVSLNVLAEVDPENPPPRGLGPQPFHGTQGLAAIFKTWNGAVFAPHFGTYGAMVYYGGGHFGYYGTQLSVFDLASRRWIRINEPVVLPGATRYQDYDFDYSKNTRSSYWTDHPEICDPVYHDMYGTTPEVQHNYDGVGHLSPELGGGASGSLLVRARGHAAIHKCDLSSGEWSRFSEPSPHVWRGGNTGSTCLDAENGRWWFEGAGVLKPDASAIEFFDFSTRSWELAKGLNRNTYRYRCSHYWHDRRTWVSLCTSAKESRRLGLQLLDLKRTRRWVQVNVITPSASAIQFQPDVDWPSVEGAGIDYCDADGCFYVYEGQKKEHIWRLQPPDDAPLERPWILAKETVLGPVPSFSGQSASAGGLVMSRWRFASRLKSFIWADHPSQPVQLWRPAGAK
jgi:hypothetical protein